MSRHARFITAILSVLFALTMACTVTAFAENVSDIGGESTVTPGGGESYVEPGGGESYVEPGGGESYVEPGGGESYVEPGGGESYVEPGGGESYVEPGGGESYVEPGGGGSAETSGGSENNVYYDGDGNEYSNPDDVYVGGNQTYTHPASTPSTTAALYDTSKTKVDETTLSSSDWSNIKAKLNAADSQDKNGSIDFSFIQDAKQSGDNGHWLLILGIALMVLSVAGFVYLIVASVNRRKNAVPVHAGGSDKGKTSAPRGNGTRYRANTDYDDDFNAGGSDKAEKSAKKKSGKPKNGKRYK